MLVELLNGALVPMPTEVEDGGAVAHESWLRDQHEAAGLAAEYAENARRAALYAQWVAEDVPEAERRARLAALTLPSAAVKPAKE